MASGNKQNKYINKQKFCLEKVYQENFSQKRNGAGKNTNTDKWS